MRKVTTLAVSALIVLASSAAALDLTGGPSYSLPGGSNCTISGIPGRGSGATVSCTIEGPLTFADIYFGIRNDTHTNGNAMDGSGPSSFEVFRYSGQTSKSIIYTSSTTLNNRFGSSTQDVNTRLVLTLTSGTGAIFDTGGTPANTTRGDIQKLFRITSSSFTIQIDVSSNTPPIPTFGESNPNVFDPTHTPSSTRTYTNVDLAFYYNGCSP